MTGTNQREIELKILGVLCFFVLCGILVAGLWPFHARLNNVSWLKEFEWSSFGPSRHRSEFGHVEDVQLSERNILQH